MQQIALDIGLITGPTLKNFFPGPNEAALRHIELWVGEKASAVTRSPVPSYLWGSQGSGKTHLLKAVKLALHQQDAIVGWLDTDVTEPPEFNESWAAVLMDNVHLYSVMQQHAAFNWFVNAQTHQRAVLAAGASPPADLKLREDLRTRLGWGHVFQLQILTEVQRRAVLGQEAVARGFVLSDEVVDFMLHRFSRDLASLMELLDLLDGYAMQTKRAITIPLIKSMMENS
jgi:DnaA-homolog protein